MDIHFSFQTPDGLQFKESWREAGEDATLESCLNFDSVKQKIYKIFLNGLEIPFGLPLSQTPVTYGSSLLCLKGARKQHYRDLLRVQESWTNIQTVAEQTRAICLEALGQNSLAWDMISPEFRTQDLIREALSRNGFLIGLLEESTPEDDWTAVRENPNAVINIPYERHSEEIMKYVVTADPKLIECVYRQSDELCWTAIQGNPWVIDLIDNPSPDMCYYVIERNPGILLSIPRESVTKDMIRWTLTHYGPELAWDQDLMEEIIGLLEGL